MCACVCCSQQDLEELAEAHGEVRVVEVVPAQHLYYIYIYIYEEVGVVKVGPAKGYASRVLVTYPRDVSS
jgi:hypothetical protein